MRHLGVLLALAWLLSAPSTAGAQEPGFLMRVDFVVGGGYAFDDAGQLVASNVYHLIGEVVRGEPPSAGTEIWLGRTGYEPLNVQVVDAAVQDDGRLGRPSGLDVEIRVTLAQPPTADQAAALERALRAWDDKGVLEGFGLAGYRPGPGYLHGLATGPFGARWKGAELRWVEGFGSADPLLAIDDLARRLAGYAQRWGVAIKQLTFDEPTP